MWLNTTLIKWLVDWEVTEVETKWRVVKALGCVKEQWKRNSYENNNIKNDDKVCEYDDTRSTKLEASQQQKETKLSILVTLYMSIGKLINAY